MLALKNKLPVVLTGIALLLATNLHDHSFSYLYLMGALSLLLSLILVKFFNAYHTTIKLPVNCSILFFLAFIGWSLLSVLWSAVPSDSLYSAVIFWLLPLGIVLGFWSHRQQQSSFQWALVLFVLITLVKAYYQRLILTAYLPAPGFFSNKNTNASFIVMMLLPFCAYFLSKKEGIPYKKLIIGLLISCCSFIIALTVSRGAVLGLSIGLFFLFVHTLLQKNSIKSYLLLLVYLFLGVFIAELLTAGGYSTHFVAQSLNTDITTVSSGRNYLWNSGWQMYQEKPFLGHGLNLFHWLFPQFRHPEGPDLGQFAHNDYLQFLIELGPIGLLLFLGFIVSFFKSAALLYLKTQDQDEKLLTLGLITACLAVFTHSFFTFNLYQPAPLLLIGLYMGVLTQKLERQTLQQSFSLIPHQISSSKKAYIAVLASISLLLIYSVTLNTITLYQIHRTYPNNLMALENAIQASHLIPYKEEYIATQANLYVELLAKDARMFSDQGKQQLLDRGMVAVDKAIEKNPLRDLNYINKATLYLFARLQYPDALNKIIENYSKAVQLNPFNLITRLHFVDVLMQFNQQEKAIEVLNAGLGKTYVSNYQNGIIYLQKLLALMVEKNNQTSINNIKQQLDELIDRGGVGGYFTLQHY